jgi:hypothetical protein
VQLDPFPVDAAVVLEDLVHGRVGPFEVLDKLLLHVLEVLASDEV